MNTKERKELIESLKDKEYRESYVRAHTQELIAAQIREMRERRQWTQGELGLRSRKLQETISQLENPDYGGYSLRTLQRLASAFDVALVVRFEPFSRLIDYVTQLEHSDLAVLSFEEDIQKEEDALDTLESTGTQQATANQTTQIRPEPEWVDKVVDLEEYRVWRASTAEAAGSYLLAEKG